MQNIFLKLLFAFLVTNVLNECTSKCLFECVKSQSLNLGMEGVPKFLYVRFKMIWVFKFSCKVSGRQ